MCIRDRVCAFLLTANSSQLQQLPGLATALGMSLLPEVIACLLYTSDAADERSSVDLGGRRIIKKKSKEKPARTTSDINDRSHKKQTQKQPREVMYEESIVNRS